MNYIETNLRGDKFYYLNNLLHRDDGPAIELANGTKCWYKNGQRHRIDGPAIEHYNGNKEWHLNGIYYGWNNNFSISSWKSFIKTLIFS